jgi:hypothetical protein
VATVYSVQLLQLHGASSGSFVIPAGVVCVVRDADCFYPGGLGQSAQLEGPAGGIFAYFPFAAAINGVLVSWRGRQIFNAGDTVTFAATTDMDITVSGYHLSLP